ncbi:MAG: hypothetical protein GY832_15775 [Chloroflexi bacterium]|nr:hypothetical protein [Chloroflexota bacterium]
MTAPSVVWQSNLAVFTDPALGLTMDVPGDWCIHPRLGPAEAESSVFSSSCAEQDDTVSPSFTQIEISPGPLLVRSPDQANEYVWQRGFDVAAEERLNFHGWEAVWFEMETAEAAMMPPQPSAYALVWMGDSLVQVIVYGDPNSAKWVVSSIRPVGAGNEAWFELGGHVSDWALPYADEMHYAGMNWAKAPTFFEHDASDLIKAAHDQEFKIQLTAVGSLDLIGQPGFEQEYADWVAAIAAAGADAIEVWHEPNLDREWPAGHISPQAYTDFLCIAYDAIKAANPDTAVISAAPAPTGFFGGCTADGCDDEPWMQGLYDAGAVECMDYIGAHNNIGATSPSARIGHPASPGSTHHAWYFISETELYYDTFHGTRQVFFTELGYASQEGVPEFADSFAWAHSTTNSQQAEWLAEAVQLSIDTGMVRCIIVWNIDLVRHEANPFDGYAIIRPDQSCPACNALHQVLGTR